MVVSSSFPEGPVTCFQEVVIVYCESIVDNGTREGLDKFLKAASKEPETVLHYEFMQDYKVRYVHFLQ